MPIMQSAINKTHTALAGFFYMSYNKNIEREAVNMIELYQLTQLTAIARHGTLSKAAEELHLSQPALSRSMQKLEGELQVSLFIRQKNKMEFNENGKMAVEYAEKILDELQNMNEQIRRFDRSRHTIFIGFCAPAPMWGIVPTLSDLYPDRTIATEMKESEVLLRGLKDKTYQMVVLPFPVELDGICCVKYEEEHLFFSLPPAHPLSASKALHLKDLNGETMLLRSKIGFWNQMCQEKMPDTHFLVQEESFAFDELVKASALPSFTSDIVIRREDPVPNRVMVPILDKEANVTFYCLYQAKDSAKLNRFLPTLG